LEAFVKEVKEKEHNLALDAERKRKKAKEEIDKLRKLLDEKEKEIDHAITSAHTQRQHSLDAKVTKAKAALEKIPGTKHYESSDGHAQALVSHPRHNLHTAAITAVQSIIDEKSAMPFLRKYEDGEQDARDLCNVPVPTIGKPCRSLHPREANSRNSLIFFVWLGAGRNWFSMPGLRVDHLNHIIKQSLKYQDLRYSVCCYRLIVLVEPSSSSSLTIHSPTHVSATHTACPTAYTNLAVGRCPTTPARNRTTMTKTTTTRNTVVWRSRRMTSRAATTRSRLRPS
jgi:hypothetical protein